MRQLLIGLIAMLMFLLIKYAVPAPQFKIARHVNVLPQQEGQGFADDHSSHAMITTSLLPL